MNRAEFLHKSAIFEKWCFEEMEWKDVNGLTVVGVKLICFTFYRSPQDQLKEFEAGRSHVKFGKHQQWLAKDYALFDDINQNWICEQSEIRWRDDGRYTAMGEKWESMGGEWGGRWKGLSDIYHFQG